MAVFGPGNRGIWNGPTGRSHGDLDAGRGSRAERRDDVRHTGFDARDRFTSGRPDRDDRGGAVDRTSRRSLFGGVGDLFRDLIDRGVSFFKKLFAQGSYSPKPILPPGGLPPRPSDPTNV